MMWEIVQTLVTLYAGFGAYCGAMWSHDDGEYPWPLAWTLGSIIGIFVWPFGIISNDIPVPQKRTVKSKAVRIERKRLAKELMAEQGRVEVLEMSATHRKEMAKLDQRRKAAEEVA